MTKKMPNPRELADHAAKDLNAAEAQFAIVATKTDAAAAFASYALVRLSGLKDVSIGKHSRPAPAAVEYAAWLLFPYFGKGGSRDAGQIQELIDALEKCNRELAFTEIFPVMENDEKDDPLSVHVRLQSGLVRGSAYPHHLKHRIAGVFSPFESDLSRLAGIGPVRAFDAAFAIAQQIEDNVNGMKDAFHATKARGEVLFSKGDLNPEEEAELAAIGAELQRIVGGMEGDWAASYDQIATRLSGLTRTEWDALRAIVGLTVQNRPQVTRLVDMQDRSLYYLSDERCLLVLITAVFDAIFSHFDDLARVTPALSNRYGNRVAEWMESEIEQYLWRLFPRHAVFRGACFPDPDNPGGETESDAIVIWGPFLVVVEAKGKRLPREAMRGSEAKLKQTLQNNIQDAFYQARRVVRILDRDGKITFKEKLTGRTIEITKDRLNRVMPISVTLQHLSGIPTQLAATQRLGLFKGKAYPWSVCIDELEVITRFVGSPDAFLFYIERRTAHQASEISFSGDELDIFGQYLDSRLHPSIYQNNPEFAEHTGHKAIGFNDGQERFEKVYAAEWHNEPKQEVDPQLKLPPGIEPLLQELRCREDDGARWIAFSLLGFSNTALRRLAAAVADVRGATCEGKRVQRITTTEDDIVINVMAHAGLESKDFYQNTLLRTRLEHYRARPRATFTLGIDQRNRMQPFETASWIEGPWQKEEIMEQLLAEDREAPRRMQLYRAAKKPGRNDPCPCNSGKKFKRCCLDKISFESRK